MRRAATPRRAARAPAPPGRGASPRRGERELQLQRPPGERGQRRPAPGARSSGCSEHAQTHLARPRPPARCSSATSATREPARKPCRCGASCSSVAERPGARAAPRAPGRRRPARAGRRPPGRASAAGAGTRARTAGPAAGPAARPAGRRRRAPGGAALQRLDAARPARATVGVEGRAAQLGRHQLQLQPRVGLAVADAHLRVGHKVERPGRPARRAAGWPARAAGRAPRAGQRPLLTRVRALLQQQGVAQLRHEARA